MGKSHGMVGNGSWRIVGISRGRGGGGLGKTKTYTWVDQTTKWKPQSMRDSRREIRSADPKKDRRKRRRFFYLLKDEMVLLGIWRGAGFQAREGERLRNPGTRDREWIQRTSTRIKPGKGSTGPLKTMEDGLVTTVNPLVLISRGKGRSGLRPSGNHGWHRHVVASWADGSVWGSTILARALNTLVPSLIEAYPLDDKHAVTLVTWFFSFLLFLSS